MVVLGQIGLPLALVQTTDVLAACLVLHEQTMSAAVKGGIPKEESVAEQNNASHEPIQTEDKQHVLLVFATVPYFLHQLQICLGLLFIRNDAIEPSFVSHKGHKGEMIIIIIKIVMVIHSRSKT